MAKLQGPLLSVSAHGKLARDLIYSRRKENNICRQFHMPDKKITLKQWTQRHIIGLLTAHWQVKSDTEKLVYEDLAAASDLRISGFNYFIKVAQADMATHHGLLAYYSCNESTGETLTDNSGGGNHGTLEPSYPANCPVRIASFRENYGNALDPDGINDYVDFPTGFMDYEKTQPLSFVFCLGLSNGHNQAAIFTKGAILTGPTLIIYYDQDNGRLLFWMKGTPSSTAIRIYANVLFADTQRWNHYTITYSGNGLASGVNFSKNGKLVTGYVLTDTLAGTIKNAYTARLYTTGDKIGFCDAQLDEFRIYNRVLSGDEITKQYNLLRLDKERQRLLLH